MCIMIPMNNYHLNFFTLKDFAVDRRGSSPSATNQDNRNCSSLKVVYAMVGTLHVRDRDTHHVS